MLLRYLEKSVRSQSTVNEEICEAFLTLLQATQTITAAVIGEVLNAFMELYNAYEGDAHNDEAVFRRKGVCDALEKSDIILKGKTFYIESE